MQAVILHIDTEKGFRGGQQQALYLHHELLRNGCKSYFATPRNSLLLAKLHANNAISYTFRGELDILSGYKLSRQVKKLGVNILHAHSAHALAIAHWIQLFAPHCKIVGARRVDFPIRGKLSRIKYSRADRIVCISHEIEKVMLACGVDTSKLRVIHSGVDLSRFENCLADYSYLPVELRDCTVVGTVAALVGHKDYPTLLEAAEICLRANPKLVFVALGDGPDAKDIHALAANEPLKSRFLFMGYQKNVGSFMKTFRIFTIASKKEGLGTAIIDAMGLGLPIVATNAGGIPELIRHEHSGLLVEKKAPQKLAAAIIELVNNPARAERLGATALEEAPKFSMQKMVDSNAALYSELLNG
ncbi:MAG: glycosyltransferase [Candidatus Cloacimonetes bacterium]|nr:glycosyltransferase [Candidatus Cloacimonadota bacterium]